DEGEIGAAISLEGFEPPLYEGPLHGFAVPPLSQDHIARVKNGLSHWAGVAFALRDFGLSAHVLGNEQIDADGRGTLSGEMTNDSGEFGTEVGIRLLQSAQRFLIEADEDDA